jgi:hypothetical protein
MDTSVFLVVLGVAYMEFWRRADGFRGTRPVVWAMRADFFIASYTVSGGLGAPLSGPVYATSSGRT